MWVRPASSVGDARLAWIGPGLALALGSVAYRPLLPDGLLPRSLHSLESWFFRPSELPELLVIGVSGWLLWRRRQRLQSLPARGGALLAAALAALGAAFFVWALLTRAADLLLPSLSANLLAFAAAARGRAGSRVVLLPALVMLLGVQIPAPLHHEIVWQLQLGGAAGAAWLLQSFGQPFLREGVMLHGAAHAFHVIDACSGLRGIEILTLIAVMVRELFADSGWRQWLLVLIAPGLGYVLNVVRIAYIAATPDPEALVDAEGHTAQGIAVLVAGTGILYGLGWGMDRFRRRGGPVPAAEPRERTGRAAPWGLAAAWLGGLAALSLVGSFFEPGTGSAPMRPIRFPASGSGWTSQPLENHPRFIGPLPAGQALHRRYEQPGRTGPEVVEVFVGLEVAGQPNSSRILSSRLRRPGPDWIVEERRRTRAWLLGRDADLTVASHGPGTEHAVVLSWRLRDAGLWRESLRSLLALDASPFRREGRRGVVRLVAYAPHEGQLVLDWARQRLERFIAVFREDLAAL